MTNYDKPHPGSSEHPMSRHCSRVGVLGVRGWSCRVYYTRRTDHRDDTRSISTGVSHAIGALPEPQMHGRSGDAFLILHPGREQDYAVLCYWQNTNELIVRVWIRAYGGHDWVDAKHEASFCVWDMLILDAERTRYIENVLASNGDQHVPVWPDPQPIERDGLLRVVPAPEPVIRAIGTCVQGVSYRPLAPGVEGAGR